jgi:hypothetical protein
MLATFALCDGNAVGRDINACSVHLVGFRQPQEQLPFPTADIDDFTTGRKTQKPDKTAQLVFVGGVHDCVFRMNDVVELPRVHRVQREHDTTSIRNHEDTPRRHEGRDDTMSAMARFIKS